jgi:hypothetical protein
MRVLLIDNEAKEKAEAVMAYARKHVYDPSVNGLVPGDNPEFVCNLNTYRCVFTYTRSPDTGSLYRHLSVSVPSKDFPSIESVGMIASLFEFTGADQGVEAQVAAGKWLMRVEREEPHCIILAEELTS